MAGVLPLLLGLVVVWAAAVRQHAVASTLWGLTTMLFFAPAGALFALIVSEHSLVGALAVALVATSGLVLGVVLLIAAARLAAGRAVARDAIGRASIAHHAIVLAVMPLGSYLHGDDEGALLMLAACAIPCAVGAFAGWRLAAA